jgi:hypothetical protein
MIGPALALTAAVWLASPSTAGAAPPPDLRAYAGAVHHVRVTLDRLAGSAQISRPAVLRARRQLAALTAVRLPSGQVLRTSCPVLAARIDPGSLPSLRAAAHRLDALDGALRAGHPSTVSAADLSALDAVLADSRFHPSRSLLQRFDDWLGDRLNDVLIRLARLLGSAQPSGGPVNVLVIIVLGILFLGGVAGVAFLVVQSTLRRAVPEPTLDDGEVEPATALAAARREHEQFAAGDYRSALRYLLLSTLLQLQERGVLELRPGLTNREYVTRLRAAISEEHLPAALGALVDMFDRVWYGHLPIDAGEYERSRQLAADALRATERGRVA